MITKQSPQGSRCGKPWGTVASVSTPEGQVVTPDPHELRLVPLQNAHDAVLEVELALMAVDLRECMSDDDILEDLTRIILRPEMQGIERDGPKVITHLFDTLVHRQHQRGKLRLSVRDEIEVGNKGDAPASCREGARPDFARIPSILIGSEVTLRHIEFIEGGPALHRGMPLFTFGLCRRTGKVTRIEQDA